MIASLLDVLHYHLRPLAFLTSSKWPTQLMTSSRSLGCCRSKTWRITSRIGACQTCLHLMFMFTDVCACEIRRREVNEACRCACPDGIAPSKVSTSDDACDDHFLTARSQRVCCLDHCPRPCIRTLPNSKSRTLKSGTLV